jgi:uncharacterized protein YcfJ
MIVEVNMKKLKLGAGLLGAAVLVAGCATAPMGPRVAVMPAPGKPFEQFQAEELSCRQYAEQSVGGGEQRANDHAVATTVIATAIGAVAGAALGGHEGAAVGAAAGLVTGAAAGGGQASAGSRDLQHRYDIAYQQCMYSRGNQLPGYYSQPSVPPPAARSAYYAPPTDMPPPPPGTPPPPPPGVR